MALCNLRKSAVEACCVPNCHCDKRRRRAECVGIEMKQYRMQNRYTNHLPGHFYCRHGFDLNQACSLCAIPASLIASGDDGEGGQVIRLERRKELRQTRPVSTGDDAGRTDAGNA